MQNTMEMVSMAVVTMGLTRIASETVETLEPLVTVTKAVYMTKINLGNSNSCYRPKDEMS